MLLNDERSISATGSQVRSIAGHPCCAGGSGYVPAVQSRRYKSGTLGSGFCYHVVEFNALILNLLDSGTDKRLAVQIVEIIPGN